MCLEARCHVRAKRAHHRDRGYVYGGREFAVLDERDSGGRFGERFGYPRGGRVRLDMPPMGRGRDPRVDMLNGVGMGGVYGGLPGGMGGDLGGPGGGLGGFGPYGPFDGGLGGALPPGLVGGIGVGVGMGHGHGLRGGLHQDARGMRGMPFIPGMEAQHRGLGGMRGMPGMEGLHGGFDTGLVLGLEERLNATGLGDPRDQFLQQMPRFPGGQYPPEHRFHGHRHHAAHGRGPPAGDFGNHGAERDSPERDSRRSTPEGHHDSDPGLSQYDHDPILRHRKFHEAKMRREWEEDRNYRQPYVEDYPSPRRSDDNLQRGAGRK
ncbi:uncharacterized protein LY89DRAFT_734296 [Mollisia scopiformis]|uniref:Uncharacterized protein n=1 Tax=Mollisia scopiformis TaxID=149040 RepID=A0A194X8R8_MOLSC|nr:uncharacterized protein LY89DRAFT_734296 [Mollisia scopiformis]KUJ16177.1 hypothetical protein LY89DRAFT_734296 [Mollisia scopiformis]